MMCHYQPSFVFSIGSIFSWSIYSRDDVLISTSNPVGKIAKKYSLKECVFVNSALKMS